MATFNAHACITVSFSTIAPNCGNNNGSATCVVNGGQGPYTYSWDNGQTEVTASNLLAGDHVVTVSDINGCSVVDTVILYDVEVPHPAIIGNETQCTNFIEKLTISNPKGTIRWYNSYNNDVVFDSVYMPLNIVEKVTYYAIDSVSPSCISAIGSKIVTVVSPEDVVIDPVQNKFCSSNSSVSLLASPNGGVWSGEGVSADGVFDPSQVQNENTTLFYAYDIGGCNGMDSITVYVKDSGFVSPMVVDQYPTYCKNQEYTLEAIPTYGGSIIWYDSSLTNIINSSSTFFPGPLNGDKTFYAKEDYYGCKSDVTEVVVTAEPCGLTTYSGLTPNGDNYNDVFIVDQIDQYPENHVVIFNRWGGVIREFTNYDNIDVIWDGKSRRGEDLPFGTYFYVIEYAGLTKKGWVILEY
ncbi:MAG: gliding motility-associated C-terminal domain-containing protein [Flavobacteriales bacterium]|nr:gliding motility-associated C-terminal domain-containing protein [Flavobacteriales bacterium]